MDTSFRDVEIMIKDAERLLLNHKHKLQPEFYNSQFGIIQD